MVLFIEKEAKHPLVKFFVAITLLSVLITGFLQVREAIKSNYIANESLLISNKSLSLSNKMAAYSILNSKNLSEDMFISAYNTISEIESGISIDIKDLNAKYSNEIVMSGKDKEANVRFKNSSLNVLYSNLDFSYIGLYFTDLNVKYDKYNYMVFGLHNSKLTINSQCDDSRDYIQEFTVDCVNENGGLLEINLKNSNIVNLENVNNSVVSVDTLSSGCLEFENNQKEKFDCKSKELNKESSFKFNYDNYVSIKKSNNIIVHNNLMNFRDYDIGEDVDNEKGYIAYDIINSFNVLFNDFHDTFVDLYGIPSLYRINNSTVKYSADNLSNIILEVGNNSRVVIEKASLDDFDEKLGQDYLNLTLDYCIQFNEQKRERLKSENDGFYEGFFCEYDKVTLIIKYEFEGLFTVEEYSERFYNKPNGIEFFKSKFDENLKKKTSTLKSSKIILKEGGGLLVKDYSFVNSNLIINPNFYRFKIVDSIVDESSKIIFDFTEFDDHVSKELCLRINDLLKDNSIFVRTDVKLSQFEITPHDACDLNGNYIQ